MGSLTKTALSSVLIAGIAAAQPSTEAALKKMPPADANELVSRLQRERVQGAPVDVDADQVFTLAAAGGRNVLDVVPVLLWPNDAPTHLSSCGVVFAQAAGATRYVPLLKPSPTHVDICQGVSAVSLMTEPGPRPRLLVLFDASAGHGPDYVIPFVLRWSAAGSQYEVDAQASQWLLGKPGSQTVAGVRRLLAARR